VNLNHFKPKPKPNPNPNPNPNPKNIMTDNRKLYNERKRLRVLKFTQGAWSDDTETVLEIPEGMTAQAYAALLNNESRYCFPRFTVADGEVIEINSHSIGD
jgi:hypothetical protein